MASRERDLCCRWTLERSCASSSYGRWCGARQVQTLYSGSMTQSRKGSPTGRAGPTRTGAQVGGPTRGRSGTEAPTLWAALALRAPWFIEPRCPGLAWGGGGQGGLELDLAGASGSGAGGWRLGAPRSLAVWRAGAQEVCGGRCRARESLGEVWGMAGGGAGGGARGGAGGWYRWWCRNCCRR